MSYSEEQYKQCREEVNRLRKELKASTHPTHEMHKRYNATLQKLKEMKKEREWDRCIGREYDGALQDQ